MPTKFRLAVAGIGAAICLSLLTMGVGAQAKPGGNSIVKGLAPGQASIIFTYDGKQIGKQIPAPKGANDFEVFWNQGHCANPFQIPPVVVEWTYQGLNIAGDPPLAPCAANDVAIVWKQVTSSSGLDNAIAAAYWTFNGKAIASIPLPKGNLINSRGSGPQGNPYVDDVCFELSYLGTGIGKAIWTINGKVTGNPIPVPFVPGSKNRANDVCWYGYTQG
ncbi:MAG TPA: hypothetical protein VFB34_11125 [Chloroflexota bacterium]|nr:hypothetical protein [Chloroflexota bacterium]